MCAFSSRVGGASHASVALSSRPNHPNYSPLELARAGGLSRRGSLAAWRRTLRARGGDHTEFIAPRRNMGSVLPHAAEIQARLCREAWVACCHTSPNLMRPRSPQGGRGNVSPRTDESGKAPESPEKLGGLRSPYLETPGKPGRPLKRS